MNTDDYRNGTFTVETTKLTDKGHCNGGAYYKNILYSYGYDRYASKMDIGIFILIQGNLIKIILEFIVILVLLVII